MKSDFDLPGDVSTKNFMATLSKWVPLICAGAAVGVSIVALKEIKNVRKDLFKKEQLPKNDDLVKKMQIMDEQLMKITEYLKNTAKTEPVIPKSGTVVKNAKKIPKENIKIINEDPDEYEEVEVTDSESED